MNRSTAPLMSRENCTLVIIDVQQKLVPVIGEASKVVENIVKLIKFSKIVGFPIVLTEQQKLGETVTEIRGEIPDLQPISKITFSCFGAEEFGEHIHQLNRNTLIITGLEAHICVAQTALHAMSDYTVHVVSDAISSRSVHDWEIALERMRCNGITITSTEMLIYELLTRAGTPEFKQALPLIK
ncbi:MAG: isochorismatase family protein [Deltaproteobacteria bacterium]|nr:isochorismatase family protein [Deltaproteobacteria bacterium]MBW1792884.1 isochorismatase family protein [Deltaproteobacteria bacterium]